MRFFEVCGSHGFSPVFGCPRYTGLSTDLLAPGAGIEISHILTLQLWVNVKFPAMSRGSGGRGFN